MKQLLLAIIPMLVLATTANVYASSESEELTQEERESRFFNENGNTFYEGRPAINPDFNPDEDCNIEYYLKCIPGSQQQCPEGYHNGEDNVCSPIECQEGYHGEDDDETGLCYPDDEGCSNDAFVMRERDDGNGMTCSALYYICNKEEHKEKDYCIEYLEENNK